MSQGARGRVVVGSIMAAVVAAWAPGAYGQNFYQVSRPRVYRIDPPLSPPVGVGWIPQMLATRIQGAGGAGTLLLSWQTPDGQQGDAIEARIDFEAPPPAESSDDTLSATRIPALALVRAMDYDADRSVAVMTRTTGTRQAQVGLGRLVTDGNGNVTGVALAVSISPLVTGGLGNNVGPEGIAFGGLRSVGGATRDTALVMFAGDPAGLWAADRSTGAWIDADPDNSRGASKTTPLLAWSGNTGTVNHDPGRHQLRAVNAVGYNTFLLTARRRNPDDAGSIEYFLIQYDTLVGRQLAVLSLSDVFDSRITSPSEALGGGLDIAERTDGTIRIAVSTAGSGKFIGVLDGRLVPEGSPVIGDGGGGDAEPAVVWVCPGLGFALPVVAVILAACLTVAGSRRRRGPCS